MEQKIYNLGILAHVDAGKTTLTEQLLYKSNTLRRAGRVDDGTAQTDFLDVEKRRGISVRTASTRLEYQDAEINLIDTPGHVDFAGEVERSLSALDCAILVVSAVEGIQAQTKQYWDALRSLGLPAILVINKLDRIGSDSHKVLEQARKELCGELIPLETVHNEGSESVSIRCQSFAKGEFSEDVLLALAEVDPYCEDALLTERAIPPKELEQLFLKACQAGKLTPVLYTCAKKGLGCTELLDAVIRCLPEAMRDDTAPLSGVVYQIDHDSAMGKGAHVRLFAGILRNRDEVKILGRETPEKITQIRRFTGQKAMDVGEIRSGDIGAVYGLGSIKTGDVIGLAPPNRSYPLAVSFLQVRAFPDTDEQLPELVKALRELADEDPHLELVWLQEERELHLNITGFIQLEILTERIRDRYKLGVSFSNPSVIYKETPTHEGTGFESYTMPKPCWAVVKLFIEPLPRGSGIVYSSAIKDNIIPYRYQNHIQTSVFQNLKQGVYGWEVRDAKITLIDGGHHHVHTHPLDFFVATPIALLDGLTNCGSLLLEPVLSVRMTAEEDMLGRVLGDILAMRGKFDTPVILNGRFTLDAELPVATSLEYPVAFRSLTSGKGTFSSRFSRYQECPLELGATAPRRGINPLDRAKWILWARNAI